MSIEHRNIPESGLHEPKGISLAGSSRVYISDGNGSGLFRKVDVNTLQGSATNSDQQENMLILDGTGGFSSKPYPGSARAFLRRAGSFTLNAGTSPVTLTEPLTVELEKNVTTGSNFIEIVTPGVYSVTVSASLAGAAGGAATLRLAKNDVYGADLSTTDVTNGDNNVTIVTMLSLQVGDTLKLGISSSGSTSVTISHIQLRAVLEEAL